MTFFVLVAAYVALTNTGIEALCVDQSIKGRLKEWGSPLFLYGLYYIYLRDLWVSLNFSTLISLAL